jgi:hypothetical protein
MVGRLERETVIRESCQLFGRYELCIFVGTVAEGAANIVFAIGTLAGDVHVDFGQLSDSRLEEHRFNRSLRS